MSDSAVEAAQTAIEEQQANSLQLENLQATAPQSADLRQALPEDVRNVAAEGAFMVVRAPGKLSATYYSHDSLGLNSAWALELGLRNGQHVAVFDATRSTRADCHVRFLRETPAGKALLTVKLREALGMPVDALDELVVAPLVGVGYDKVGLQSLENVTDNRLYLPRRDFELIDRRYAYYLLGCLETGCTLPVRTEDIACLADDKSQTTMRLNRYQRLLLRLEAPLEMPLAVKQHVLADPRLDDDQREAIETVYEDGRRPDDLDYDTERTVYAALANIGFLRVELTPVAESYIPTAAKPGMGEKLNGVGRAISDAYLGASSLTLRCVRPYDVDESRTVVRLSPDTMALLGIDETDQVVLRNGDVRVEARVLTLDNREELEKTNLIGSWESADVLVGVPASLRHKLGVKGVGTCIEVERDTGYLFMKNLNLQFLTMLGLFLTILQTVPAFGVDPVVATIAFVILLPIVIYIVLSGERKRVK